MFNKGRKKKVFSETSFLIGLQELHWLPRMEYTAIYYLDHNILQMMEAENAAYITPSSHSISI